MRLTLAILAAGRSARFGRSKQLEPIGPSGEALFEYTVHDAIRAGCDRVVFVTPPREAELLQAAAEIRLGRSFPVEFISQSLEDVPAGFRPPAARVKPWGTGHAVLALRDRVREPFLVANADDFYGARTIARLVRRIRDGLMTGDPSHYLAGYELQDTGVPEGRGVNRGLCSVDASLIMERLEEVRDIATRDGEYVGTGTDGLEQTLRPERLVSMNLWAFQPSIFAPLAEAFKRFHARLADPIQSEFLLSDAVGALVETGRARIRVVPTGEKAFGLTHPDDLAAVESGVSLAVAVGDYPTDLGRWFENRKGGIPG